MPDRLYSDLAEYYDLLYHWKPYADEAARIRAILSEEGVEDGSDVVDVACGTGSHLEHLRTWYQVRGLDLNPGMVTVARRKLPQVPLQVADMMTTAVSPPAAALLCLFSAIGYVFREPNLTQAVANFARGLRPGGVLMIEPWLTPATFGAGMPTMQTYDSPDLKLCRSVVTRQDHDLSVLEFHWLIAEHGSPGVVHEVEEHRLWLCPLDTLLETLRDAGIQGRVEHDGLTRDRPLIIGRKG